MAPFNALSTPGPQRSLSPVRGGLARNRRKIAKGLKRPGGLERSRMVMMSQSMGNLLPEYDPDAAAAAAAAGGDAAARRPIPRALQSPPPRVRDAERRKQQQLEPLRSSVSMPVLGQDTDVSAVSFPGKAWPAPPASPPATSGGAAQLKFSQNMAHLPVLRTGEDVISYFCKHSDSTLIKFKYLNRAESGKDFRPYDLVVVEPNEVRA